MEGGNLLSGGIDQLNEMKDCLLELYGNQSSSASLRLEEDVLEKSIAGLEQSMREEIQKTTKKRRQEIENTFHQEEDKLRQRSKRLKEKREKNKSLKVSERISSETASLRAENGQLRQDIRTLFKQQRIPRFCDTKLYYALYSPGCFTDYLVILLTLLITLLLIPCGVYFLFLQQYGVVFLILTYVVTVVLFGGSYILIGSRTKERHPEEIQKGKGMRRQLRMNRKKMAVIRNNIRRDRDESSYGLQDFDEELAKLEQEAAETAARRKEALAAFDNSTSQIITAEIEENYKPGLTEQKAEYDKVRAQVNKAEDKIKELTLKVASDYEPVLGKAYMTIKRVDALIQIIQAGNAASISEAIAFHKANAEPEEE
ncbi:exonuclease VII large subunit [Anaerotaenia torta]|uniref:hypothetical protein n=1 Tax=Anaerotaenia torta TaxID=433293 RepID=UPI003D1D8118